MSDFQVSWLELGFRFIQLPLFYIADEELVWYTPYDARGLSSVSTPSGSSSPTCEA